MHKVQVLEHFEVCGRFRGAQGVLPQLRPELPGEHFHTFWQPEQSCRIRQQAALQPASNKDQRQVVNLRIRDGEGGGEYQGIGNDERKPCARQGHAEVEGEHGEGRPRVWFHATGYGLQPVQDLRAHMIFMIL